jgi:raffinose/stachyose/melibiose transport system permease protein
MRLMVDTGLGVGDAAPALTAAAGGATRPPKRRREQAGAARFGSWWWTLPALTFVLLIHYIATGAGGFYAFTDWTGIGDWNWIGLENFRRIAEEGALGGALKQTLIITIAFVVCTNVLGLLFALALNRTLKSRYFLRVALFAPVVLSPLAVAYVFRFIFAQDGPLNQGLESVGLDSFTRTWLGDPEWGLFAIIVVMVWQQTGLAMVIYLAGLASVPIEQEEAATLDGANAWQRFRYVVLPSIQPSVAIASTLTLITGLRAFDQVMAMTGGGPFGATDTLATVIYRETFAFGQFGYGAALSLVLFVLVLAAALLQLWATAKRD